MTTKFPSLQTKNEAACLRKSVSECYPSLGFDRMWFAFLFICTMAANENDAILEILKTFDIGEFLCMFEQNFNEFIFRY